MGQNSKIEWTDHTFNPWRGCTKVSAGCANYYAETLSGRNPGTLGVWGPKGTRVVASESMWEEPLKWNRDAMGNGTIREIAGFPANRPRVFCASMADVFEDWTGPMTTAQGHPLAKCRACSTVGHSSGGFPGNCKCGGGMLEIATMSDVRARLFALIDATPNLDWLLLTKRPENIAKMMPKPAFDHAGWNGTLDGYWHQMGKPRANLWLGVSCENQQAADERIPHLLRVPAKVRFLSCEPLLGPVELGRIELRMNGERGTELSNRLGDWISPLTGAFTDSPRINWVIVGGESGPGARPMNPAWARSLRDQCQAAGVPFFMKQWGEYAEWDGSQSPSPACRSEDGRTAYVRLGKKAAGRLLDGREWNEFPAI